MESAIFGNNKHFLLNPMLPQGRHRFVSPSANKSGRGPPPPPPPPLISPHPRQSPILCFLFSLSSFSFFIPHPSPSQMRLLSDDGIFKVEVERGGGEKREKKKKRILISFIDRRRGANLTLQLWEGRRERTGKSVFSEISINCPRYCHSFEFSDRQGERSINLICSPIAKRIEKGNHSFPILEIKNQGCPVQGLISFLA